jgi:hypothetical protein
MIYPASFELRLHNSSEESLIQANCDNSLKPGMGGSRFRFKVLRFAFLGGKRFEVQGSTCQENFFKV